MELLHILLLWANWKYDERLLDDNDKCKFTCACVIVSFFQIVSVGIKIQNIS